MKASIAIVLAVAAGCTAALRAGPARAADEDTQFWIYMNSVVPVGDKATATLELSPRFREGGDQFLTRGVVDYKLTPHISLGGGAAYVINEEDADEIRTIQQLTLTTGSLAFRTRVEERFFEDGDRAQLRLRQRVQLTEPIAKDTRLSVSGELLYIARTEDHTSDPRVDSWRFATAIQHRFSKRFEGGLGYLLIYAPKEGKPDKISHVPQLTLTARL